MAQRNPLRERYKGHILLVVEEWHRPDYATGHLYEVPMEMMGYSAYIDDRDQGDGIVGGVENAQRVLQRLRERVDQGDVW